MHVTWQPKIFVFYEHPNRIECKWFQRHVTFATTCSTGLKNTQLHRYSDTITSVGVTSCTNLIKSRVVPIPHPEAFSMHAPIVVMETNRREFYHREIHRYIVTLSLQWV